MECVAATFKLDLIFFNFLSGFYWPKISIYMVNTIFWNTKYLRQREGPIHTKILQTFNENKFPIEETNYRQTSIPVVIFLLQYKTNVC